MKKTSDFIITDGLLEKYIGTSDAVCIPDGVSAIASKAFIGCKPLKSVILPASVTKIGDSAIKLTKTVVLYFRNRAFSDIPADYRGFNALCGFVEYYKEFGESAEIIASYADFLKSKFYEIGIKSILENKKLLYFAVNNNVLGLDESQTVLSQMPDSKNAEERAVLLEYMGRLEPTDEDPFAMFDRVFEDGFVPIQNIAKDWLFKENDDGSITLTKYIGAEREVTVPSKVGDKAVTVIGDKAFRNSDVVSVIIPYGVTRICDRAFAWCENLESVTIPNSVKVIEDNAFRECIRLEKADIPDSVEIIDYTAFAFCANLAYVYISKKTAGMPTAFAECSAEIVERE